ncbi:MAG: GNAT family N-acetyltransferase [Filomicrobium sp.]
MTAQSIRQDSSPCPACTDRDVVITSISEASSLQAIAEPWREFETHAANPNLFTSVDWCRHAFNQLDRDKNRHFLIAQAYENQRLVALWPLSTRKHGALRIASSIAAPFDQYSDLLLAPDVAPERTIDAILDHLRRAHVADGLILRKVKTTSDLYGHLRNKAHVINHNAEAPHISLDPDQPFDAFLKQLNSKTRKNLRNYANRLQREGNVEHVVIEGPKTGQVIAQCFDERNAWLTDNGYSSEAFRDPHFKQFLLGLAKADRALGLVAFVLKIDGEPVALQWGFIRGDCYYAFMSCRNPKYESFSVGRLHLRHIIEVCHKFGLRTIDLMVPASPYKMNWTKQTEPVVDIVQPWSAKGHVVLGLLERNVRPAVKRCLGKAPTALRKPVMALLNR